MIRIDDYEICRKCDRLFKRAKSGGRWLCPTCWAKVQERERRGRRYEFTIIDDPILGFFKPADDDKQ